MRLLLVFVAVVLALFVLASAGSRDAAASTCTMIEVPDPFDRIDLAMEDAEVIALGVVMSEGAMWENDSYYEAQVSLLAVLKGDIAASELSIRTSETTALGAAPASIRASAYS